MFKFPAICNHNGIVVCSWMELSGECCWSILYGLGRDTGSSARGVVRYGRKISIVGTRAKSYLLKPSAKLPVSGCFLLEESHGVWICVDLLYGWGGIYQEHYCNEAGRGSSRLRRCRVSL